MPIHPLPFQSVLVLKNTTGIDLTDVNLMMVDLHHFKFKQGTLLRLTQDDGSHAPRFSRINGEGESEWINIDRLTVFDPEDLDHIIMRAKARLKGID